MSIRFMPIPTAIATALRDGPDANGQRPQTAGPSTASGTPCRHCLRQVPAGQPYLILAHRPFDGLNPYTETGPIFLCAEDCAPGGRASLPREILQAASYITRAYSADERIIYGTGAVTETNRIADRCVELLADPLVAFVHIRSTANNCFLCRVERANL